MAGHHSRRRSSSVRVNTLPCCPRLYGSHLCGLQMKPVIHQTLSRNVLRTLLKSGLGPAYTKALGNVRELYKQALGANAGEVQIPLPSDEKPKFRPEQLSDEEVAQAITPLFDYFETNLLVLNESLSATTKETVMLKVWKELLNVIEMLLLPPLSEAPTDMKPLSEKEVDIVFKWLKVCVPVSHGIVEDWCSLVRPLPPRARGGNADALRV